MKFNMRIVFCKFAQRCLHTSSICLKEELHSAKGLSASSQNWLRRQINDPYVKAARYDNYRARSAYKLLQIDEKYSLLKPGMIVIDLGAAPGAFTQYIVRKLRLDDPEVGKRQGAVISIDLNAIHPIPGAVVIPQMDFTKPLNQAKILDVLNGRKVDFVCSDMAPKATGIKKHDHDGIITLAYSALQFAVVCLKPHSGAFLAKIWDGGRSEQFMNDAIKFFDDVAFVKPQASRGDSAENFILARGFKGIKNT